MARMWHCQICEKQTQFAVVLGGVVETPDGRVLSAQFRGTCAEHRDEIGARLVETMSARGVTEMTVPTSVKTMAIPAWRRAAERELNAHASRGE